MKIMKEGLQLDLLVIKPRGYHRIGMIIESLQSLGRVIVHALMVKFDEAQANFWYEISSSEHGCSGYDDGILADVSVAIAFHAPDSPMMHSAASNDFCIEEYLINAHGHCNKDGIMITQTRSSSNRMLRFFFGDPNSFKKTNIFRNCLLLIIKPHVMNPHAGRIIDIVLRSGIEVSGLRIVKFSRINAERLLEVYRGVLRDFGAICDEISSGPSMILEVRQDDISTKMKVLCGPADPDMARIVAPDSIRAVFGISSIFNAIHVTELEEEGPRECHYAFGLCD